MEQGSSSNLKSCMSPPFHRSMSPASPDINGNNSFKISIQQIKSNIEKATKPLFNTLQKMMDDLSKSISQQSESDEPISVFELQNRLMNDYHKTYEDYCYQLMHFSLEYALTENEIKLSFGTSQKDGMKNKLQVYFHQIKQHMQMKKKSSLKILMNKLFSIKQNILSYQCIDSDEEGFFDGQSEQEQADDQQNVVKINNKTLTNLDENWENAPSFKKKIDELQQIIKDLEFKLKNREETVQYLTSGYVKDIQHMKEMLFRQANLDDLDFYEVQYFDSSCMIDDNTRLILNDRLKDVKIQFDKKTQDLLKKIVALSNEIERLKKIYCIGPPSESAVVEAAKKLFVLEESPYKIWKIIQDIKGNQFFFNVFELQRPEYGINYKEVNKMLMCKKVYEKEYNDYKASIDNQLQSFITQVQEESSEIQEQLKQKNKCIEELNQQLEKNIEEEKKQYILYMEDILNQRETELNEQHEQEKQDILKSYEQEELEKDRMRNIWLRWACVNRVMKASKLENIEEVKEEIKKILFNNSYQNEANEKAQNQMELLKNQNNELLQKVQQFIIEKILTQQEISQYNDRNKILQQKLQEQNAYLGLLKSQNFDLEAKKTIFENVLQQIYNKLGIKLTDKYFEDLDLENEKKFSTKEFSKKIKALDKKQFRTIRESKITQEKVSEARSILFQRDDIQHQEVQTCLYGVDTKFEDFIKQVEQDLEDQGSPEEIEKLKSLILGQEQNNNDEGSSNENIENKNDKEMIDEINQTDLSSQKIDEVLLQVNQLKSENTDLKEIIKNLTNEQSQIQQQMESIKIQKDIAEKQLQETSSSPSNQQGYHKNQTVNGQTKQIRSHTNVQSNIDSSQNTSRKSNQNIQAQRSKQKDSDQSVFTENNRNTKEFNDNLVQKDQINQNSKSQQQINGKTEENINSSRVGASTHQLRKSKVEQNGIKQSLNHNGGSYNNLSNISIKYQNGEFKEENEDIQGDITALRRKSQINQNNLSKEKYDQRSDDDDYYHDLADEINRDNEDENAQNKINDRTLKRESGNSNSHKKQFKGKYRVFERLFQDSKDKQDRMEELKKQLQKLETLHWEEVLSILNLYRKQLHEELRQYPEEYFRQQKSKSPRENVHNTNVNQSFDMKRLNIRQNYQDISQQPFPSNNKFPYINPSPIQGGRAEYYFKKQKDPNHYNSKEQTYYYTIDQSHHNAKEQSHLNTREPSYNIKEPNQYNSKVNPLQLQLQQHIHAGHLSDRQQDHEFSINYQESNQDNSEKRKIYLEQVFENFRKHNKRIQIRNKKEHTSSDMKLNQKESYLASRKQSMSFVHPKAKDLQTIDDSIFIQNTNNSLNYSQSHNINQFNNQINSLADQSYIKQNLYDEPYVSQQNTFRTEDSQRKYKQLKKLKPIQYSHQTSSNNNSKISIQNSDILLNKMPNDKNTILKTKPQKHIANPNFSVKKKQNGGDFGDDKNVFLPESIQNLVKKSKLQQMQIIPTIIRKDFDKE